MLSEAVWQLSRIDFLHQAFDPLTPQGRRRKETKRFITDARQLASQYDLTDAALALIERRASEIDRIEYHLKRMPDLAGLADLESLGSPDVFVVKKFLLNYRALAGLLDAPAMQAFGLRFKLQELLARLDVEDAGEETFYVSDRYLPELRSLRREIQAHDQALKDLRAEANRMLLAEDELDFRFRDFLVVPNEKAARLSREKVFVEPHDNQSVVVRPVMSQQYLLKHAAREKLALGERKLERQVLEELSGLIRRELQRLFDYAGLVEQLDVSLAHARLCRRFGLTRPVLGAPGGAVFAGGARLLPLEDRCRREGLKYWPLDIRLDERAGVIHGSNMCGKTVAIQTVAFCQIAAQLGFFVPAGRFETTVFDELHFIGPAPAAPEEGLSSFAAEIVGLSQALSPGGRTKLLLVDEFARTTNSREAVALLSGLLAWLTEQPGIRSLLATHCKPLPRLSGLTYYRMKGLRWEAFERDCPAGASGSPSDRVRNIHRYVEYQVLLDTDDSQAYDALRVAEALGLDPDILARARHYADLDQCSITDEPMDK